MSITKGTVRLSSVFTGRSAHFAACRDGVRWPRRRWSNTTDPPSPRGFIPPPARLPAQRVDVAYACREKAAQMVLAAILGSTPEEIVLSGIGPNAVRAFSDELERDEALAHVDLLLDVLQPLRPGEPGTGAAFHAGAS